MSPVGCLVSRKSACIQYQTEKPVRSRALSQVTPVSNKNQGGGKHTVDKPGAATICIKHSSTHVATQ
eukprot:16433954-Heterocapsa_arctica.AAC.1